MITVALDASTYTGTVAIFDGEEMRLLSEGSAAMRGREAERLMPAVDDAFRAAGVRMTDVGRVVCGAGPGSFTSLRIAASVAKGLAVGAAVPLYAVSSLALIVVANAPPVAGSRYVARLNALRGESWVAEFGFEGDVVRIVRPLELIGDDSVAAWAGGSLVVGPDESAPWIPHARGLARLARTAFGEPVNLAAWEPTYGRLAEAQVKWEATHGRALPT